MKVIKLITLLALTLGVVFAVCGDRICESAEYKTCRDCAMINQNYVCDSYQDAQTTHDPDCENDGGCYGLDSKTYLYDNGRGSSCWPGRCNSGSCTTTCTSDTDCVSAFCIDGTCNALCLQDPSENILNCTQTGTEEITAISTAIYTGVSTYVTFNVSGPGSTTVQATGPCDLDYSSAVDLTLDSAPVIVGISACNFTGMGSIQLNTSDSSGVIHFLSFPTLKYRAGELPKSSTGQVSLASTLNGIPIEVRVWVG
ncbi:MAG: hypothetical protein GOV00_00940 [Candidatus Altiarchaeota archaeon]|nr:hypothetical protein [Candidatus Altiarchaeota archaeon]